MNRRGAVGRAGTLLHLRSIIASAAVAAVVVAAPAGAVEPGIGWIASDPFAGDQGEPAIAVDGDELVVAWTDASGGSLWAERASASTGLELEKTRLDGEFSAGESAPDVEALSGSGYLAVWHDAAGDRPLVRSAAAATGCAGFALPTVVGSAGTTPRIGRLGGDGAAAVAWANNDAIEVRRLDACASSDRFLDPAPVTGSTSGANSSPDVAGRADGSFVVVWLSAEGPVHRVLARRFAGAAPDGPPVEVASSSQGVVAGSSRPRVAAFGDGRVAVVWDGPGPGGSDVYGQLLGGASLGLDGGRFRANGHTAGRQDQPAVAADPDGERFVVAWRDCTGSASCASFADPIGFDGDRAGIAAREFTAPVGGATSPDGPAYPVNPHVDGAQAAPAMAMRADGDWAAAWRDDGGADGEGTGVMARRFRATGPPPPTVRLFEANVSQDGGALAQPRKGHSVDSDAGGVVTAVWEDDGGVAGDKDIVLARLGRSGARLPLDANGSRTLTVNTTPAGEQVRPQVAVHPSGRGVVAWADRGASSTDPAPVKFRQFSVTSSGVSLAPETTLAGAAIPSSSLNRGDAVLDVAVNDAPDWSSGGRIAIVWEAKEASSTATDVRRATLGGDGRVVAGAATVNQATSGDQRNPSVGMSANGEATVAWADATVNAIRFRRFDAAGTPLGGESAAHQAAFSAASQPSVAVNAGGAALIAWAGAASGSTTEIYARRLGSSAIPAGPEVVVGSGGTGARSAPDASLADDGDQAIGWETALPDGEVAVRRFGADGSPHGAAARLYAMRGSPGAFPAVELTTEGDVAVMGNAILPSAEGGSSTATENVDLILARTTPAPPTARFDITAACAGRPTAFADRSAADPFTAMSSRSWDLDHDGVAFTPDTTLASPTRAYSAGSHEALLRVTDDRLTPRAHHASQRFSIAACPPPPGGGGSAPPDGGGGSAPPDGGGGSAPPDGGGGSPPPGGGSGAPRDRVPPMVRALRVSPGAFRALRGRGPSVTRARRGGARVSYRLSERARVAFAVERATSGRRVGRRCVRATRRNRRGRRCTRYVRLRGGFSHEGRAGRNALRITGRLRGRKLRPGRYRLAVVATDAAANRSRAARARFRIIR